MNEKHIGLVGCGRWGQLILRDLKKLGCRVSVISPSGSNHELALQLGADAVFTKISDLVAVDGIVIATPTITHLEVIQEAAEISNAPIFVEKPLSHDLSAARSVVALLGKRLFVMDKWRYHAGVIALANIAQQNMLGTVLGLRTYRLGWGNPHQDVDGVWVLAPHDLSIALEILGYMPTPRAAVATYWEGEATGLFALLGEQPWLSLEVSSRDHPWRREIRLECLEGTAVLKDSHTDSIEIYRKTHWTKKVCEPVAEHMKISNELPLYAELQAFVAYLQGGPSPKSSAQEGLAIVESLTTLRQLAGLKPV